MAFQPKHGQWVKFTGAFAGAHTAPDGKTVGIYQKGYTDGLGRVVAEHVALVDPDGLNIVILKDRLAVNVRLDPVTLADLEPAVVPDDCPAARVAHLLPA